MTLQHNTVLITGGSSGIGLELARQLLALGNTVVLCGRSPHKLADAQKALPQAHTVVCDVSDGDDRRRLVEWMAQHHPACNVLVNNAAIVHRTEFRTDDAIIDKAARELATNLMAPIALSKLFLPLIEHNPQPAIVNITTGLVFAPRAIYPIYNATKAALHSFTQVLRLQMRELPVKIIEVMMPVVDTPWHNGAVPSIAISPEQAVRGMLAGIGRGRQEVHVGAVRLLYTLSRLAPGLAVRIINRMS